MTDERLTDSGPGARKPLAVQDVIVDGFKNGAARKVQHIERLAGSALLALLVAVVLLFWRGGAYVQGIESAFTLIATRDSVSVERSMLQDSLLRAEIGRVADEISGHAQEDDIRTEALAGAAAAMHETMAVIVAEQVSLRRDVERLED